MVNNRRKPYEDIYTSYFGNMRNLPEDMIPISICGKAPLWYKGLQYKKLAPKYHFFMEWKKTHDNDYYIERYQKEVLNFLNVNEVIKELCGLVRTRYNDDVSTIVLLCYEKPDEFCHRHLVFEWLTKNGFDSEEFNK